MKILCLQGGARKKGNTAKALEWAQEEIIAMGHEVESVYLTAKNLNGCMGCAACKNKPDEIGCVQKDDMPEILGKLVKADAVIFASPLYFWGVTAQLKAVIDRTYSLYTRYHEPGHASLVDGQRQALLMTGAGPWDNNAEAAFTAFSRLQNPHKSTHPGDLYLDKCTTPGDMDDQVKDKVIQFARKLVR